MKIIRVLLWLLSIPRELRAMRTALKMQRMIYGQRRGGDDD